MTHQLRRDILRNACDAFEIANPQPELSNDNHRVLRQALLEMPVHDMIRIIIGSGFKSFNISAPSEKEVTAVDIHPENSDSGFPGRAPSISMRYKTVQLQSPLRVHSNTYGNPDVYIADMKPEHRGPVHRMILDLSEKQVEHGQKYHEYRKTIDRLLDQCTSVKQFLDAWPAGEQFVPVEALQRMQQKVTRQQRAQKIREEVNFDASDVNEVVLTAKVMGL
jgi:hypothetical protein